jgi:hypothetical protein
MAVSSSYQRVEVQIVSSNPTVDINMHRSAGGMIEYCFSSGGPEEGTPGLELQSIARVEVICVVDTCVPKD